jgi:heparan-sulfate lyase
MKIKVIAILICTSLLITSGLYGQELRREVFELLDLKRPGLEKVQSLIENEKYEAASSALLDYFRNRSGVNNPEVDLNKVRISAEEQKWADDGLKHIFFVHKGYQPSYFYGEDIDWEYWPVQDNELRWQLHRHKWWTPMGKAYKVSGDEKYASEWVKQYIDWIKKNPLLTPTKAEQGAMDREMLKKLENVRYAWRPLEVSNRLQDQTAQFMYFVGSKNFTPEFLTEFLVNYHRHAERVMGNYSKQGNHLLFEAQRMIYAGAFFPEFKRAESWRKSGIGILNDEIKVQVYEDGFQYELDPHYHLASINIFIKGIEIADVNGYKEEFPVSYLETVEKMIMAVINYSFPNYQNPCFSDAKLDKKPEMLKNYKRWAKVFPKNNQILYMATEGKKGELPAYLSKRYENSGFFIFRNGWKEDATVMVLKAGPPAFWHNQPDNGTFELYVNGRNFFPDAGSYVYAGSAEVNKERDWFRQTMVHKTLTLNNANIEQTDSKCLLWETGSNTEKLVVENQSYADLKHRRTVFFVDKSFFVIVDEAAGNATGDVAVHYQLSEGKVTVDTEKLMVNTLYTDNNNMLVQGFGAKETRLAEEEGWVSYAYRQKNERPAFSFRTQKNSQEPVRFITVIYPVSKKSPCISAKFSSKSMEDNQVGILLKVNKKKYELQAKW